MLLIEEKELFCLKYSRVFAYLDEERKEFCKRESKRMGLSMSSFLIMCMADYEKRNREFINEFDKKDGVEHLTVGVDIPFGYGYKMVK